MLPYGHLVSYERPSLQVKDNCTSYFETDFFKTMAAALNVYYLPEFLLHMTILKIF